MSFFWISLIIAVVAIAVICLSSNINDYLFKKYYGDDFRKYKRYKDINDTVTVFIVVASILACVFLGSK